ncbi:MAG: hypothetical protein JSS61_05065 [Verrucomicrobia bacterium]|nr:hypothetical protein [Verrucomicrobiota bacterium]
MGRNWKTSLLFGAVTLAIGSFVLLSKEKEEDPARLQKEMAEALFGEDLGSRGSHKLQRAKGLFRAGLQALVAKDAPPDWLNSQMTAELAPWKEGGITQEVLGNSLALDTPELVRYAIRDQRVSVTSGSPIDALSAALTLLTQTVSLPDVDFLIAPYGIPEGLQIPGPIFSFGRGEGTIALPTIEALCGHSREHPLPEVYYELYTILNAYARIQR